MNPFPEPSEDLAKEAAELALERGEILTWQPCPIALPKGDDLTFLLAQRLKSAVHKNISYHPGHDAVSGCVQHSNKQTERLHRLMRDFSRAACFWLASLLPRYAQAWQPDRASLRPEEEATRKLRLSARNDLLHFDAFPSRPTQGLRILRCYININPTDDRVWMTSDNFAKVLAKYGNAVGLPAKHTNTWVRRLAHRFLSMLTPNVAQRTDYDEFMLRLHHFLKSNDEFQERAPRKLWHFQPGTAWLFFSDSLSHAELRGQYALEHSFFVAPHTLVMPDESPFRLLERMCADSPMAKAA
jgi:hypothetical protein